MRGTDGRVIIAAGQRSSICTLESQFCTLLLLVLIILTIVPVPLEHFLWALGKVENIYNDSLPQVNTNLLENLDSNLCLISKVYLLVGIYKFLRSM